MNEPDQKGGDQAMERASVERRRGRRANIEAPLLIRRSTAQATPQQEVAKNVSLAGLYFETEEGHPFAGDDIVFASVSIPEERTRDFPFARLAGRGRVVRIHEMSPPDAAGRKRFGIALEFGHDLTALSAIPSRG